jgi:hypothetical protein
LVRDQREDPRGFEEVYQQADIEEAAHSAGDIGDLEKKAHHRGHGEHREESGKRRERPTSERKSPP